MISFNLKCESGHRFDGWFRSSEDFERQQEGELVVCPVCGTHGVEKALMAPAVSSSVKAPPIEGEPSSAGAVVAPSPPEREKLEAVAELWSALQKHARKVRQTAQNVGPRFAEEARKIHYDESEHRTIYGEATRDDVDRLTEEGIMVMPLAPLPEDQN